jgi:hypothetical protein
MWVRVIFPLLGGITLAWIQGFTDSSAIFLIPIYALPFLWIWMALENKLFPPNEFEPVPPPFLTLDL